MSAEDDFSLSQEEIDAVFREKEHLYSDEDHPPDLKSLILGKPRVAQDPPLVKRDDSLLSEGIINDMAVRISVEIGTALVSLKELRQMGDGSLVELNRTAGAPVIIKANGKTIAYGEIVVIDDNFGVRFTDILKSSDKVLDEDEALPYARFIPRK